MLPRSRNLAQDQLLEYTKIADQFSGSISLTAA